MIYVGHENLDVPALIRCAKVRKEHSRPLEEVTVVLENEPGVGFIREVESLRETVAEAKHRVCESPILIRRDVDYDEW